MEGPPPRKGLHRSRGAHTGHRHLGDDLDVRAHPGGASPPAAGAGSRSARRLVAGESVGRSHALSVPDARCRSTRAREPHARARRGDRLQRRSEDRRHGEWRRQLRKRGTGRGQPLRCPGREGIPRTGADADRRCGRRGARRGDLGRAVASAIRRRARRDWATAVVRRPAIHHRRRDATRRQLPSRRRGLAADRVRVAGTALRVGRATRRRPDCAAAAGRNDRSGDQRARRTRLSSRIHTSGRCRARPDTSRAFL